MELQTAVAGLCVALAAIYLIVRAARMVASGRGCSSGACGGCGGKSGPRELVSLSLLESPQNPPDADCT